MLKAKSCLGTEFLQGHREIGVDLVDSVAGSKFVSDGGRLRDGERNVAMNDVQSGVRLIGLKLGSRVIKTLFCPDGKHMILVGSQGQADKKRNGNVPDFDRADVFETG